MEIRKRFQLCTALTSLVALSGAATPPVVETSADERLMLITGKHRDDVLAVLNETGARGYRFRALTSTPSGHGVANLRFLLERAPDTEPGECQYAFAEGTDPKRLNRMVGELAAQGFRIAPGGMLERPQDYVLAGSSSRSFLAMTRLGGDPSVEYSVVGAQNREAVLTKALDRCRRGYRFIGLLSSPMSWVMTIWERPRSADESDVGSTCDREFEYLCRMRRSRLKQGLDEHASEGWQLIATAAHGFGGSRCVFLSRKHLDKVTREYRYRDESDGMDTWQGWLEEGFRFLPETLGTLMALERGPTSRTRAEYRLVAADSPRELLDATSAALADGFRVLGFLGENAILASRQSGG